MNNNTEKPRRKTNVAYKKHIRDKNGELRTINCFPPKIEAQDLDLKAIEDIKDNQNVVSVKSKGSLTQQRKAAAETYKMETGDLIKILSEIAYDKNQITTDRIKAINQASKMLGLDAPTQIETTFKGIMLELSGLSTDDICNILSR